MEVIFLGTGTSEGVPIIAQSPEVAIDLDNPKNWRTRTSIHVVMDGCHIQVDASPEFRLQCIHNDIRQIDHFILTHGHSDHVQGMDDLRRFCRLREGRAIPVYGHVEGLQRIREIYPYAIRDSAKGNYPAFQLLEMPTCLELEGGTVHTTLLPHGRFYTLGLVFVERSSQKKFAYFTDCNEITRTANELAKGADLLAIDALRFKPHHSHLTIPQALIHAQKINAYRTRLVHMTCDIDHVRDSVGFPKGVEFACDGMVVSV